jgi:hypothetical protein
MTVPAMYPEIDTWFAPLLRHLREFPSEDYVPLRWELDNANKDQYRRDLRLLDRDLATAARHCWNFTGLIGERRRVGKDRTGASRLVLDKLAEVRAVAGLHALGFHEIAFQGTPDLVATDEGTQFAIEVTRLADSPTEAPALPGDIQVAVLGSGDQDARWKLADEFFAKIKGKRQQLSAVPVPQDHIIWISLGRDYFTAGLYERRLTGLRRQMPMLVAPALELAAHRVRRELGYPQLRRIVVCPGREKPEIVYCLP